MPGRIVIGGSCTVVDGLCCVLGFRAMQGWEALSGRSVDVECRPLEARRRSTLNIAAKTRLAVGWVLPETSGGESACRHPPLVKMKRPKFRQEAW